MNKIIRHVKGLEVAFHHNSYYRVNGWLESQNMKYDQFNILVDPQTYSPIPCAIRFHNEQDLLMFLLRWS
jgi:hypothetical protein